MTYTETLDRLATATAAQVVAAYESWQEDLIDYRDFLAVVDAYMSAAGNRATALADTALAAYLTAATGKAVPALGLVPVDVDHRPEIATIAAMTGVDLAQRFGTHARATTLATAQDAYSEGITRRGIPGWTRVVNGTACSLCRDLAGPVLPGSVPMYHHKGMRLHTAADPQHRKGDRMTDHDNTIETTDQTNPPPADETTAPDADAEPETFPREYVQKLRDEAAKHRTRAQRADDLAARLHVALVTAAGRLADPSDLAYDDAHLDDTEALSAAIDDLLARKPHLATRRPSGDVGQGASASGDTVDLAGILRSRAS